MKNLYKKVLMPVLLFVCMFLSMFNGTVYQAATKYAMFLNADGGTFEVQAGMNFYDTEQWVEEGKTLAGSGFTMQDPTCAGKQFTGWYGYNKDTGAQLENGKLFTTQEVLNYVMPSHAVEFKAQWQGASIKAITYAALYNGSGAVDYNVKVTLINNGVCYSGYGFVTIPESVYSTWTGTVESIWEFPGEYINANRRYIADYFDAGSTSVADFKKEKNCWQAIYKSAGEAEVMPPQTVVNDFYTYASTVMPEVSVVSTTQAGNVISDSSIVPANYTITTNLYESGSTYDNAVSVAQSKYGSSNVLVYNIDLKDANGADVHQLSGTVDVKLQVPTTYTIQPGYKTVVFYLSDDGSMEECETVYDDATKTVTFKTNHFSVYVVAEVEDVPETITTEDASDEALNESTEIDETTGAEGKESASFGWVIFLVIGIAIVAIVVVILIKKKNS